MVEEGTLRRLLASQAHRMNGGVVADDVPLYKLVGQSDPTAQTREGSTHHFDPAEIQRFAERLSPLVRVRLQLPLRFVLDHRVDGSAFVTDPVLRDALLEHGEHVGAFKGARAWLSLPRAQTIAQRYPSLVQFQRQ